MLRQVKYLGLGLALVIAAPASADVRSGLAAWEKGDYAKAVKEWQPAANKGDADAQFNLGQAYRMGRGVAADPKRAEELFLKAANQNHPRGQLLYAITLKENGAPKDGIPWLEKSARSGDREAQYLFGIELYNGTNVAKDLVRAYGFMTLASEGGGSAPVTNALAAMDKAIPAEQKQQGVAMAAQLTANIARMKAQQQAQANRQAFAAPQGGGGGGGEGGGGSE